VTDRPPRRRGVIWRIYQITYWLFVVGFLASVSLSVTWHVMAKGDPKETTLMDAQGCARGLRVLYDELHTQGELLLVAHPIPATDVDAQWVAWSNGWRKRSKDLRGRCPVDQDPALLQLADDVDRMHLAWSTAIKGFADMGRPPLQRLQASFDQLETR
jgi:hypothetical protein